MAEPTRPSTDIDKPATSYDDFTPTFIMKTDNIANLRLGPQFYKCNITIQDPEMAEDDNQREITLSSHDSIHEIAEAGRLLQSVIQRTVGAEARSSRIFIRAIQCIDLTGGQDSDADSKLDYPPTQEPIYNPVTEPEAPKNTNDAGVETIPNSPVPPSFQQGSFLIQITIASPLIHESYVEWRRYGRSACPIQGHIKWSHITEAEA